MDPIYFKIGGLVLYSLAEYWLGKTDKVKSGSVIELALNLITALFKPKENTGGPTI